VSECRVVYVITIFRFLLLRRGRCDYIHGVPARGGGHCCRGISKAQNRSRRLYLYVHSYTVAILRTLLWERSAAAVAFEVDVTCQHGPCFIYFRLRRRAYSEGPKRWDENSLLTLGMIISSYAQAAIGLR
jgi:hypothetical protein